jgi:hypothetical protein
MSNAAEVMCSSKLSNSSDGVEKIDVSLRLSKYSSTFLKINLSGSLSVVCAHT